MATIGETIGKLLKKIIGNRVVFSDGSYLEYLHREGILYVENDHQLEIMWYFNSWLPMKGRVLPIAENFSHWDAPHEEELIPESKKNEILGKIKEYCKKRKIRLDIEKHEFGGHNT